MADERKRVQGDGFQDYSAAFADGDVLPDATIVVTYDEYGSVPYGVREDGSLGNSTLALPGVPNEGDSELIVGNRKWKLL